METNNTTATSTIIADLRADYDLTASFEPDTKITIMHHDSYIALLEILTPAQRSLVLDRAHAGQHIAVAAYVAAKL